jgi:serine/threonine protein kinase
MTSQANCALPRGFQIDRYRIERQISVGGFSIVYLAFDTDGTPVALKEYLPSALALRKEGETEPQVPAQNLAIFRYGMLCFFEEGRALARLMHPNVVRVLNFFRANGTVYMVMQYERGRTLQEHIRHREGDLAESFVRKLFVRMLNGLREVHSHKLLHLDIKPANIFLRNDGTPVLLDFGAARQTLSASKPMLKPMYTPGYAPPEQYAGHASRATKGIRSDLGPWSDIYSVGASLHTCLTGKPPQRADERLKQDELLALKERCAERYSSELLELVDWCLQLDHLQRPQSVYAVQKILLSHLHADDERPASRFANRNARLQSFIERD